MNPNPSGMLFSTCIDAFILHYSGRAWASPELHEKPEAVYIYLFIYLFVRDLA